jgi:hypothetical protein
MYNFVNENCWIFVLVNITKNKSLDITTFSYKNIFLHFATCFNLLLKNIFLFLMLQNLTFSVINKIWLFSISVFHWKCRHVLLGKDAENMHATPSYFGPFVSFVLRIIWISKKAVAIFAHKNAIFWIVNINFIFWFRPNAMCTEFYNYNTCPMRFVP